MPVGFMPAITRGLQGSRADRDGRAARARRGRLHRRRPAGHRRRRLSPRAAVPAPVRRRARAARGGPVAVGHGRDARGRRQRAARRRRHPERQRVDDDRPRLRAGRATRARGSTSSTCPRASRSRSIARAKARGVAGHLRGQPAPPDDDRRGRARPRHAPQDEPAAARARPTARRSSRACAAARSTASRPTTRRTRATRRRCPSSRRRWARPAWRRRSRRSTPTSSLPGTLPLALVVEKLTAGLGPARPVRAADRGRRAGEPRARRPRRRVGRGGERLREPLGELLLRRAARCAGRVLLTVAAGAVAYRERSTLLSVPGVSGAACHAPTSCSRTARASTASPCGAAGGRDRRGRLHDRHVGLPGVGHRPELRRPDHHVHLSAHRQLRRLRRRRWSPTASGRAR